MQLYTEKQEIAFLKNSLCIKGQSAESLSLSFPPSLSHQHARAHTHRHMPQQTNQRTHINMQSGVLVVEGEKAKEQHKHAEREAQGDYSPLTTAVQHTQTGRKTQKTCCVQGGSLRKFSWHVRGVNKSSDSQAGAVRRKDHQPSGPSLVLDKCGAHTLNNGTLLCVY